MANIGLPGTSSFVGEFLILVGSFKFNTTVTVLGATSMVIGGCYSLWLLNRIIYGNLKTQYINNFSDLTKRDLFTFRYIYSGFISKHFLCVIQVSTLQLTDYIYF